TSEQLLQHRLDMMGRATTPEMQAQQFRGAVRAEGWAERLGEAKAREDVKAREDLLGAVRDGNTKLDTLAEILRGKTSVPAEVNFREGLTG
ncbi:MAG: hypothetical protein HY878_03905, partial [Deltaproteobacteria bacterium]|nr:hypothetical protein [Deltaproteobacteria bacterium]